MKSNSPQSRAACARLSAASGADQCCTPGVRLEETKLTARIGEVRSDQPIEMDAAHFAAIVKSSEDAIVGKDLGGIVTSWNPGAERIFGYSASEMIGQSITRLIPPERQDEEEHVLGRIREGKSLEHYETVRVAKDGRRIDISLTVSPIRNAAGEVTGASKVARDITRRKRAEEALRASEARLRQILDSNIVGVVFWNLRGDITEANDLYLNMVGYTREALRAGNLSWKDITPPEYTWLDERSIGELLATGTGRPYEKEYIRKDGSRISILIGSALIESERETGCSFVMDITERKRADDAMRESERKYRDLVEMSHDLVWAVDTEGRITYMSPASRRIYGREPEEMTGRLYTDFVPPEEARRGLTLLAQMVATGNSVIEFENRVFHRDGHEVVLSANAVVRRDAAGSIVGTTGASRDITERKEAERRIEHFADLFQSLSHHLLNIQEEERRHLARELHDEIGQTLTAAKLNLKIIAGDVPPAVAGCLEDSVQLIDRLHEQVRQLSLDLRPPLLDELGLVPALRWLADQQAQRSGLRVTFMANVECVEIDPPRRTACFRVAQEAITNAIRHAGAATVIVELQAEPDCVWLVVQDDGVGFEKDATQQRAKGGASIGLLSMNERVSLLGGELEVNSAPGRGTEIRAWFPLALPTPNITSDTA